MASLMIATAWLPFTIGLGETAAAQNGDADRLEEAGIDVGPIGRERALVLAGGS